MLLARYRNAMTIKATLAGTTRSLYAIDLAITATTTTSIDRYTYYIDH